MDKKERAIRQRLKDDFIHYAEKCLKIRLKTGGVAPLILNPAQRYIHEMLERQKRETGRVRALVLKGRQQGCSTYVAARFYWQLTHRHGASGFVLTHLEAASKNIYKILRCFHKFCPVLVRPEATAENMQEMVFGNLETAYRIGSAGSAGVGRSDSLQYFHGSEVAYWPQATTHMAGILQAVPDLAETEIILESTSGGAEGLFYKMCMAAQNGEIPYQLIFVPWFWQPEYALELPEDGLELTAEEKDISTHYDLTPQQIYWRRMRIGELGGVWAFRREYPATVEEAFHADRPGALWTRAMLEKNRVQAAQIPPLARIVIAIDPAVTSKEGSDETGIIVAGLGEDGHGYILEDLSGRYSPRQWAQKTVAAFCRYKADRIVAEVNQGGDMVTAVLKTCDPHIPVKTVRASRGKYARAEPVAALDEAGQVHHAGVLGLLEDQMCAFLPGGSTAAGQSPDRVDARVWAISELMLGRKTDGPQLW
jgi:phage terminase large subunit-like protein